MKLQELAAHCVLALALVFVLVDQTPDKGLQHGHRGWCSANVLAVIERAKPANGFVGYTMEYAYADGSLDYDYFDRYPVFFSAGMHVLLNTFELSSSTKIFVARQAMNVLYALALVFAMAFLVEVGLPAGIAVAAAALAGSGKLIVEYRDMVHFDWAAMVGFMGLLWAIARYYRKPSTRFILIASGLAVLMGRGYASFAVLGVWWIVEAVRALRTDFRRAPLRIATSVQTRACLLAIALAGSCLAYNVWTEARTRQCPISEVGIVRSAQRRLLLNDRYKGSKKKLDWAPFSERIAARGLQNLEPYIMPDLAPTKGMGLVWGVLAVAAAVAVFVWRRKPPLPRAPLIVASLAGLAWIFPMRGLTAFHEFTTMFLLSLGAVFAASLLRFVPARVQIVPALLACAVLVASTHKRNAELEAGASRGETVSRDLERVAALLKPREPLEVQPKPLKLLRGVPYALGFYLPDQPLLAEGHTELVLSAKKLENMRNLTPDNREVFLYRRK